MSIDTVLAAREELIRAALRVLAAERAGDDYVWADASAEYADELLALAARDLTRAFDAGPEDERPIGWGEVPGTPVVVSTCCGGVA